MGNRGFVVRRSSIATQRGVERASRIERGLRLLAAIALLAAPAGSGCSDSSAASAPQFFVCESTYALCTTAPCTALADAPGFASCSCSVQTDYSAGPAPCSGAQDTGRGQTVVSRYHPIKSYAKCTNDRPWAQCLGSPCVIDPTDPSRASCICTLFEDQGSYVFVNADGEYSPSSCTTGLFSSATVVEVDQVTDYLKTHDTPLKPFPIVVHDE